MNLLSPVIISDQESKPDLNIITKEQFEKYLLTAGFTKIEDNHWEFTSTHSLTFGRHYDAWWFEWNEKYSRLWVGVEMSKGGGHHEVRSLTGYAYLFRYIDGNLYKGQYGVL